MKEVLRDKFVFLLIFKILQELPKNICKVEDWRFVFFYFREIRSYIYQEI